METLVIVPHPYDHRTCPGTPRAFLRDHPATPGHPQRTPELPQRLLCPSRFPRAGQPKGIRARPRPCPPGHSNTEPQRRQRHHRRVSPAAGPSRPGPAALLSAVSTLKSSRDTYRSMTTFSFPMAAAAEEEQEKGEKKE